MIVLRDVGVDHAPGTPWEVMALDGVDLRIGPGERVLVTGPNGSGKSTLAWVLAGLVLPARGTAELDGVPLVDARDRTGIAFQHPRMQLLRPTVGAELESIVGTRSSARYALGLVGLGGSMIDRRVDELSGGEQRRVVLAGLLARPLRLVVLDEPIAGLDETGFDALRAAVAALAARGTATVVVTHERTGLAGLGDRVVELDHGRVSADRPLAASEAAS
ncbi:MAG: ABC transporter ATP-binding protein [Actinomycetota bacterium]|nr:ABC transporter ATP-binding protein [Actinomycetota bacterium]